jgi:hypothetical protein
LVGQRNCRPRSEIESAAGAADVREDDFAAGQDSVTIPGEDVSPKWDLMYYFEVLNRAGGGWFCPDPQTATPYYVVKVRPAHGGAD